MLSHGWLMTHNSHDRPSPNGTAYAHKQWICLGSHNRQTQSHSAQKPSTTRGTACRGRSRRQAARAQSWLAAGAARPHSTERRPASPHCGIASRDLRRCVGPRRAPHVEAAPLRRGRPRVLLPALCRSWEPGGGLTIPLSLHSWCSHRLRKIHHRCAQTRPHGHWSTGWHVRRGWCRSSASRTRDYDRSQPADPRPWHG